MQKGGSLEMWDYYFDGKCQIYGIDIDKKCLEIPEKLNKKNIKIDIGDQSDREFWKTYLKDKPKFDIIIDDGGHKMNQQIVTYEEIHNHITNNGIYLCEDTHTSYWKSHGGELKNPNSFIEYSKNFIDMLNYHHIQSKRSHKKIKPELEKIYKEFRENVNSVHYYDSIIVLEFNKDKNIPMASKKK